MAASSRSAVPISSLRWEAAMMRAGFSGSARNATMLAVMRRIGRTLIERGWLPREGMSMQVIRDWLHGHPQAAREVMESDPSYVFFEEKPQVPRSTLTGIALYYYPTTVLPLIQQYISEGNNPDQPGRLVQWLYPRVPFYVWKVPGLWFDVGSIETLEEANRVFSRAANE